MACVGKIPCKGLPSLPPSHWAPPILPLPILLCKTFFMNKFKEQPQTVKWWCAMTFVIDERVSCIIMHNNLLINQESHCTASFHGWWFLFSLLRKWLEWSKLWGSWTFKRTRRRRSHPSGGMQLTWDFINPHTPTKRCFGKSIVQRYECHRIFQIE